MSDDDTFTEVSEKGWLDRLGGSLAGMLFGVIMVLGSVALLIWNEGRAVEAIAALDAGAKAVVSISPDAAIPANDGRLVHVTGPATAARLLKDPAFHVGGPGLLRLERRVEMYQWREEEESKTETSVGGKETTRTDYRYSKRWSEEPIDSSAFKKPAGHVNPPMPYRSQVTNAHPVKLGAFTLDASEVRQIDAFEPIASEDGGTDLPPGFRWVGEQLVRGVSDSPQVGDLRVSFRIVRAQTISVVALQSAGGLTPYHGSNGWDIDLVRVGVQGPEVMFQQAKADENTFTWIMRGLGFVMMLVGIVLVASPLAWLASVLPFLEGIVNAAAFGLGLIIALPLTLLTIALSWLAFRPLIGGGLIVAAIVLAIVARRLVPRRRHGGEAIGPEPGAV